MSQKLLFIFNPYAGKGLIKNYLVDIVDTMVKADFEVTVYTTQSQGDATRKVVTDGAGYDRIVWRRDSLRGCKGLIWDSFGKLSV